MQHPTPSLPLVSYHLHTHTHTHTPGGIPFRKYASHNSVLIRSRVGVLVAVRRRSNNASQAYSVVGGGEQNKVDGEYSGILGGSQNVIEAAYAVVGGGMVRTVAVTCFGLLLLLLWARRPVTPFAEVTMLQYFRKIFCIFVFGPALLSKQNQATDDYGTVGGGESYLDCKEIICNYKDPRIAHHSPPQNIAQLSVDRLLF